MHRRKQKLSQTKLVKKHANTTCIKKHKTLNNLQAKIEKNTHTQTQHA